jgi:hypothetical protein
MSTSARTVALVVVVALAAAGGTAMLMSPATAAGGTPKAWGAGSTKTLNDFTSTAFTSILSKKINASASGAITIVANVSMEDDCSLSGLGGLAVRLRVDGKAIWKDAAAYQLTPVECPTVVAPQQDGTRIITGPLTDTPSTTLTATVPVTAGNHAVELQAAELGTGSFIMGRGLSILYSPAGGGPFPWPSQPPGPPA